MRFGCQQEQGRRGRRWFTAAVSEKIFHLTSEVESTGPQGPPAKALIRRVEQTNRRRAHIARAIRLNIRSPSKPMHDLPLDRVEQNRNNVLLMFRIRR